jgi:Arc/MetJ family transcription regulator
MKTTLVLGDALARDLRRAAKERGTTMSRLVEDALRRLLREPRTRRTAIALPSFDGGRILVDIADREALRQAIGV